MSVSVPPLEGPEKYHAFISHDYKSSSPVAEKIASWLESRAFRIKFQSQTLVTSPSTDDAFQFVSTAEDPADVIGRSLKVILVVTKSYLDDPRLIYEAKSAILYAEELGQPERILVVWAEDVDRKSLPSELKLHSYQQARYGSDKLWTQLHHFIVSDTHLGLSVLPGRGPITKMALSYFFGFLNLTLPYRQILEKKKQQGSETEETVISYKASIHERIKRYREASSEPRKMPLCMFIIIPESCFCPPTLKGPGLRSAETPLPCSVSRAGNPHRDYKSSVYILTDPADGQEYYFVAEYATPVLTFYESEQMEFVGYTKQEMRRDARLFYHTLSNILTHEQNREAFQHKYRMIFIKEEEEKDSLTEILLPKIKEELHRDTERISEPDQATGPSKLDKTRSETSEPSTEACVPAHLELLAPRYTMTRVPRGRAVILSVENFDPRTQLQVRLGAQEDIANLQKAMKHMQFEVEVVRNPTASDIHSTLLRYSHMDHSAYDAFICVVLTHGKLGVVLGQDGKPYSISHMTMLFTAAYCPSLSGKPKIFFIQACQGDASSAPQSQISASTDGIDIKPEDIKDEDVFQAEDMEPTLLDASLVADAGPDAASDATPNAEAAAPSNAEQDAAPYLGRPLGQRYGGVSRSASPAVKRDTLVPGSEDFIMGYATLPGSPAYRHHVTGSLYIKELCAQLMSLSHALFLDSILDRVTDRVKDSLKVLVHEEQQKNPTFRLKKNQIPFKLTTTSRRLMLNP